MSVVNQITYYQRSIEKCTEDESRVLHCIERLYKLPVTVQHLQATGVGRTVNALRKYDGTVGDAAKALVAKWKTMVVDEESSDCDDEDDACMQDPPDEYSDNSDSGVDKDAGSKTSSRNQEDRPREKENRNSSRHESRHSSKHQQQQSSSSSTTEVSRSRDNVTKTQPESSTDRSKNSKNLSSDSKESSRRSKEHRESRHESKSEKKSSSSKYSKSEKHRDNDKRSESSSSKHSHRDHHEKIRESSNKVSSTTGSKELTHDNESQRKRKLDTSSHDKIVEKRQRNVISDESDDDDDDDDNDNDNEELPDTSMNYDCDLPSVKIKSESPEPQSHKHRNGSSSKEVKKEKSSKDKSRHSSSDKTTHKSMKIEKSSDNKKHEKRHDDASSSSSSKGSPSKSRHSSTSSMKDHNGEKIKEKKSSDKEKHKNKDEHKKDKKKNKKKFNGDGGIDCNSGASFAEALGMCAVPTSSKKRTISSPGSPIVSKNIKSEPSTSSSSSSHSKHKVKTENTMKDDHPLSLLSNNVKLEPLSVDLASTLPEISPNYKPLPTNYMNSLHRKQEEDKALNEAIYAKNMRTKVYSGVKTGYTSVPSLYDLCIRILIDNIDALEVTGGVPYDIIKPVLERATADQLFMLEHHNPYLIDDTDILWKFHCTREFRNREREEMESWREMYMRCLDEREAKLKALTANIKQSIDKSVPVRSTMLAYVDNIVKPPRNVLRKQAKYGTANSSGSSASDLKKKLITGGNSTASTTVPPPPMCRMKTSSSGVGKKNKAPLMAKALQLIRGRYKR